MSATSSPSHSDVVILGAGLVGCALAVALAQGGVTVTLVDPAPPEQIRDTRFDGRASAVSSSSWRMFEATGVTPRFAAQASPIERIEVGERGLRGLLAFQPDLDGDGPLGQMVENRYLRIGLREAAAAADGVTLLMPARAERIERDAASVRLTLADGRTLAAALLIGAEGRRSPTRESAGIPVARWQYDHRAIVGMLDHAADHGRVAHELFYPAARPLLRRYARRHRTTVHLGVWDGEMVTYLIKETRGEAVFTREGMTLEGYGSAIGKVLLAHLPADEQERFLAGGPFVALTSCTIVDPSVLREQLARVARQGFAVDAHEVAERLLCCAVPIRDRSGRVHAALSQSIVHHRAGGFDPATVAEQLAALSSRVSERLFV